MSAALLALLGYVALPATLFAYHAILHVAAGHPPPLLRRDVGVSWRHAIAACVGGCLLSYLVAASFFLVSLIVEGEPDNNVVEVMPETPAEAAGLRSGDQVLAANDIGVMSFEELRQALPSGGGAVSLRVQRNGAQHTFVVNKEVGSPVGVRATLRPQALSEALVPALLQPGRLVLGYAVGMLRLLTDNPPRVVQTGPVAIVGSGGPLRKISMAGMLVSLQLQKVMVLYVLVVIFDLRARPRFGDLSQEK